MMAKKVRVDFADRERVERALDGFLGQRYVREAMEVGIGARAEGRLVPHEKVIRRIRRQKRPR